MIITSKHRVKNAIRFWEQQQNSCWMTLGQNFAWGTGGTSGSESSPPTEPLNTTTLNAPLCANRATLYMVYSDNTNMAAPFAYLDTNNVVQRFSSYASVAAARAGSCLLVLATSQITGAQLISAGSNNFREIGFSTDVVGTLGHTSDTFLPAANVADWGDLESLQFRTVMTLEPESRYTGSTIFSF